MKFYLTWWSKGNRGLSDHDLGLILKLTEISVNLINKHYGEAHLITDKRGQQIFKKLNWKTIDIHLENLIPDKYAKIWNFGKLFSLNKIANLNEPFIHIDYDFFIIKKIEESFLNKDIIVQSREIDLYDLGYEIDLFENKCKNKYFGKNLRLPYSYNCGIIGGTDVDFFKKYTESAINMILDPENQNFWLEDQPDAKNFKPWTRVLLSEQYYLGLTALFFKKKINIFFEEISPNLIKKHDGRYMPNDIDFIKESGCIHLFGPFKKKYYKENEFISKIYTIWEKNKTNDLNLNKEIDYLFNKNLSV